jgi:hypothetical protein
VTSCSSQAQSYGAQGNISYTRSTPEARPASGVGHSFSGSTTCTLARYTSLSVTLCGSVRGAEQTLTGASRLAAAPAHGAFMARPGSVAGVHDSPPAR